MPATEKEQAEFLERLIRCGPGGLKRSLPLLIQWARSRRSGEPSGRASLLDPAELGSRHNEPIRRVLEALASLSDEELVALWRHVEGLSDEEIASQWKTQGLGPMDPSPVMVAEAREVALARLRQQPDLNHIGVYYQPPNPERSAIAEQAAAAESGPQAAAVRRAITAVRDVFTTALTELPQLLVDRVLKLASQYDELERYERQHAERLLSTTRRSPGSRRWKRVLRGNRIVLEERLLADLYPKASSRVVARNLMRRDIQAIFSKIVEIAERMARSTEGDLQCDLECLARRAADHLPGGSVTGYRERVRWLRALVRTNRGAA